MRGFRQPTMGRPSCASRGGFFDQRGIDRSHPGVGHGRFDACVPVVGGDVQFVDVADPGDGYRPLLVLHHPGVEEEVQPGSTWWCIRNPRASGGPLDHAHRRHGAEDWLTGREPPRWLGQEYPQQAHLDAVTGDVETNAERAAGLGAMARGDAGPRHPGRPDRPLDLCRRGRAGSPVGLLAVTIDAPDVAALARFDAWLLGMDVVHDGPEAWLIGGGQSCSSSRRVQPAALAGPGPIAADPPRPQSGRGRGPPAGLGRTRCPPTTQRYRSVPGLCRPGGSSALPVNHRAVGTAAAQPVANAPAVAASGRGCHRGRRRQGSACVSVLFTDPSSSGWRAG